MKIRTFGRVCLLIVIFLGMTARPVPSSSAFFLEKAAQQTPPASLPEQISPPVRGLEKLSPDLRARLQANLSPAQGSVLNPSTQQTMLVSALAQPGADIRPYFRRSIRSLEVAGVQWVTGEIMPKELAKIASLPEVLGVISTETYQVTDVPGLDQLRWTSRGLSIQDMRALLQQGGPELLRSQIDAQPVQGILPAHSSISPVVPSVDSVTPAPNLRDVHDVDRALAQGIDGSGVVVGVVDTGIDFANPDLQGVQALVSSGPYAGWPFAYDTISAALYALDSSDTLGPDNFWQIVGSTQYVHTLPVMNSQCDAASCRAKLALVPDGTSVEVQWPNTSKSGKYFYSVNPDIYLANVVYQRGLNYPEGWLLPAPLVVADEHQAGIYDTVYMDVNYNHRLSDSGERVTRAQPLAGSDLDGDGTWDLSGGLLGWISDGKHHPPGVEVVYPDTAQKNVPPAGRLLVFINDMDGHGTSCASEIAGQGRITDPQAQGPSNPLYAGGAAVGGAGGAVIPSMAPGAKIAAFPNGFALPFDAWTVAVLGMDGTPNSGDEVNIVSNSWGDSRMVADGWDPVSRFAQQVSYQLATNISFLVATGNGGHGYGTVTSPGGGSILDVGASTAYGSLRGFENVSPEQFLYGDIQPWSNRGPGGLGDVAPDVVAVGAWGTGAVPLNFWGLSGQFAYDVFGGTSMSTPVAAGNLALVYEAYFARKGDWPTWEQARDFLLNGAQDLSYDVFVQGAGNVRAGRSVDIANGLYPSVTPTQWQPGSYRGDRYPAFPALMFPGEQAAQTFTVKNPTGTAASVAVKSSIFQRVHEETFALPFSVPAPEAPYEIPMLLRDLSDLVNRYSPDLVRAQVVFPFRDFDVDQDKFADNWWSVYLYDWQDRDQDGQLWNDENRDGRVDPEELDFDPITGLYEYNRFSYGIPQSNTLETSVGAIALAQRHDGVFLGLRCLYCESTTLQVRVTFYQKVDWPWLDLSLPVSSLPASDETTFTARLTVPPDTQPGGYEGAVEVSLNGDPVTIPVVVNVAGRTPDFNIGGQPERQTPYDNSHVFGGFNWRWRYESGDWRFLFFDVPEGTGGAGKTLLVDTRWASPETDLDTWILSAGQESSLPDPSGIFGPQGLELTGGSTDTYTVMGQFLWQTGTGQPRELVGAPLRDGLGMIALHNVLNGGAQLAEGFAGTAFTIATDPQEVNLLAAAEPDFMPWLWGSQQVTLTSTGDFPDGIQVQAFGLRAPVDLSDQVVTQNERSNICSSGWIYQKDAGGLNIHLGGMLEVTTTSQNPNLDLDVYLFQDDGDERWICGKETLKSYSINAGPNEKINITFPQDGIYWLVVHGYQVPAGRGNFDVQIQAIDGSDLSLQNLPMDAVKANQPVTFDLHYRGKYLEKDPVPLEGLLLIGTPSTPGLIKLPVHMRPDILLFPQPQLNPASLWITRATNFALSIQNVGANGENVRAQIQIPDGLVYQPGSADGPGGTFIYDPVEKTLTWNGLVGGAERVVLTFRLSGDASRPAGRVDVLANIRGEKSGQEWQVDSTVWANTYAYPLPLVFR